MKFYVVWKGRQTGVYSTWESCQQQIQDYPQARYKSFPTRQAAEEAYTQGPTAYNPTSSAKKAKSPRPKGDQWSVDAACSGNPGPMEYRCVHIQTGEVIFHKGPYLDGTNNIGEFLALVHALALLKQQGQDRTIYTDSMTAIAWVRNKQARTRLAPTPNNQVLFELIERAETWLRNNSFSNKILKWETQDWGEIPADFGRK